MTELSSTSRSSEKPVKQLSTTLRAGLAENGINLTQNGAGLAVNGTDNQDLRYNTPEWKSTLSDPKNVDFPGAQKTSSADQSCPKSPKQAKAVRNVAELEPTGAELAEMKPILKLH